MKWLYKYKQRQATNGSNHNLCFILIFLYPVFSRGTRAQHLTLCVWCLCRVCVCVWCPLDGCDAPIGQRGKITVQ